MFFLWWQLIASITVTSYKQNIDFVSLLYRPFFFFYIKTPYSILIKEHFNFIKTHKTSLKTVIVDVFLSIKRHLHFFFVTVLRFTFVSVWTKPTRALYVKFYSGKMWVDFVISLSLIMLQNLNISFLFLKFHLNLFIVLNFLLFLQKYVHVSHVLWWRNLFFF